MAQQKPHDVNEPSRRRLLKGIGALGGALAKVAMNAAALKTQYKFAKSTACIIIDTDCFQKSDLDEEIGRAHV